MELLKNNPKKKVEPVLTEFVTAGKKWTGEGAQTQGVSCSSMARKYNWKRSDLRATENPGLGDLFQNLGLVKKYPSTPREGL